MEFTRIVLNGAPLSTQHIYGMRGRIKYMKKEAKKQKANYMLQIKLQHEEPISKKICHGIMKIYHKDARKRDRDNYNKLAMDALEGTVIKDDVQIHSMMVEKYIDRENPRIEIYLRFDEEDGVK